VDVEALNPEDGFAKPDAKGIAAQISMTAQISQNRQIVIQTYLDRDSHQSVFNAVLDKLNRSIERQEAKVRIEEEEANLEVEEKALRNLVEDFAAIEDRSRKAWERANKRGQWRLSEAEEAHKKGALTNVERYKEVIAKRKQTLAKLRAVIAGA
jgi:hypothetical protein